MEVTSSVRCSGCYESFSGPWCENCDQWPCTCIDDGLGDLMEVTSMRTYPGRYLASTVALDIETLAAAAMHALITDDGHGCEGSARRAGYQGQLVALRALWAALDLPHLAEVWRDLGQGEGEQSASDQAVAESDSEGGHGQPEENRREDEQHEGERIHADYLPRMRPQ